MRRQIKSILLPLLILGTTIVFSTYPFRAYTQDKEINEISCDEFEDNEVVSPLKFVPNHSIKQRDITPDKRNELEIQQVIVEPILKGALPEEIEKFYPSPLENYNAIVKPEKPGRSRSRRLPPISEIPRPRIPRPAEGDIFYLLNNILNFGKEVWKVVEKGRPVVDVQTTYANALPGKSKDERPLDLQGWTRPYADIYHLQFVNKWGVTVVDGYFNIWKTTRGRYPSEDGNGIGYYIANTTIVPEELTVKFGFDFSMSVKALDPINVGTHENPIAGIQMLLTLRVDNFLGHWEETRSYFVRGDDTPSKNPWKWE